MSAMKRLLELRLNSKYDERGVKELDGDIKRVNGSMNRLQKKSLSAGAAIKKLDNKTKSAGRAFDKTDKEARELGRGIGTATKKAKKMDSVMTGLLMSIGYFLLDAARRGATAIVGFVNTSNEKFAEFDTAARLTFTLLQDGSEQARRALTRPAELLYAAARTSTARLTDRKSTRLNSSHTDISRMPSSA